MIQYPYYLELSNNQIIVNIHIGKALCMCSKYVSSLNVLGSHRDTQPVAPPRKI